MIPDFVALAALGIILCLHFEAVSPVPAGLFDTGAGLLNANILGGNKESYTSETRTKSTAPERKAKSEEEEEKKEKCTATGKFPVLSRDCKKYTKCKSDSSYKADKECEKGTRFDPYERNCVDKAVAKDCKVCIGKGGDRLPDPKSKKAYYVCKGTLPTRHKCDPGKVFSPNEEECVKESNQDATVEVIEEEVKVGQDKKVTTTTQRPVHKEVTTTKVSVLEIEEEEIPPLV